MSPATPRYSAPCAPVPGAEAARETCAPVAYDEAAPVSVAVPVFNGARYLQATLDRIARQTHRSLEIVIRDDASDDTSWDIVREFARRDTRARVARNPATLGMVGNWNRTLADCSGEWIHLVGQDDLLEPNAIETALRAARSDVRIVLAARTFAFEPDVRADLRRAYRNDLPTLESLGVDSGVVMPPTLARLITRLPNPCTNILGEPVCGLVRRDFHTERGLYQARLSQLADYEFWLRCALNEPFVYLNRRLFAFRVHGQSATHAHHNPRGGGIALEAARFLLELLDGEAYRETRSRHKKLSALWEDALDRELGTLTRQAGRDPAAAAGLKRALAEYPGLAQRLAASRTLRRRARRVWVDGRRRFRELARVARNRATRQVENCA